MSKIVRFGTGELLVVEMVVALRHHRRFHLVG
jgi:hypothetical protein